MKNVTFINTFLCRSICTGINEYSAIKIYKRVVKTFYDLLHVFKYSHTVLVVHFADMNLFISISNIYYSLNLLALY